MQIRRAVVIPVVVAILALAIWGAMYVRGHWYMGGVVQFPNQAITIGKSVCMSEYTPAYCSERAVLWSSRHSFTPD